MSEGISSDAGTAAHRDIAVFLVTVDRHLGATLARGLTQIGVRAALLTERPERCEYLTVDTSFVSRGSMADAFSEAQRQLGPASMVVYAGVPDSEFAPCRIDDLACEKWTLATHVALRRTTYCLQTAAEHFGARGGSIAVLGPSLSFVGAENAVAISTALEGQRALVKAAARQWGVRGIRVNWVAVGDENYPTLASVRVPRMPEPAMPPPALGRVPDIGADATALITLLGSESARAVTGVTLNIDGGNWMVP